MCLLVLVGIVLYPWTSMDHIALIPYIFALQPIVFFLDRSARLPDEVSRIEEAVWATGIILLLAPLLIGLALASPLFEKAVIAADALAGYWMVEAKLRISGERRIR